MKHIYRHITILILALMATVSSFGQNVRYVQYNTIHALSVPPHPAYSYKWSMTWGATNKPITINSTTNVTENIHWNRPSTQYNITVYPILDSVDCPGEPIYMTLYTVDYLSLHAFDDIYFIEPDQTFTGDVSENDFDEMGFPLIYTPIPVSPPSHGILDMTVWGEFTYTPEPGFTGTDHFIYEVRNDTDPSMVVNATVTIVVMDKSSTADLYISKVGPAKALFGDRITYDIIIKNNGPDAAENVMIKDTIPFGLFTTQYSLGGPFQPWNDILSLGTIAAGDSLILNIMGDISPNSPLDLWNQALVYSDIYDPDFTDNDSIWHTEISAIFADLADNLLVSACDTTKIPARSASNVAIKSFKWTPDTGLSDPTVLNPIFTPDEKTIGMTTRYILEVTDVNGRVDRDTMNIIVPNLPLARIESDTMFIDRDSILIIRAKESSGDRIDFNWWTKTGKILGFRTDDSIRVDTTGWYYLMVSDRVLCEAYDSVLVLLKSHPPVVQNDYAEIVAGTDSTVNVLANDYDINGFDLRLTRIVTPPGHGEYTFDSLGNITFTPDIRYWKLDSMQYEVCNNGYPEMCSTGWYFINCIRPPLNADVVLVKSAPNIAFWSDSIEYILAISSNGPDTATVITVQDKIEPTFINPVYTTNNWLTWDVWRGQHVFRDSLRPGEDMFTIRIRAFIHPNAPVSVTNKAWLSTEILENDRTSDTSIVVTKVKTEVVANAGQDRIIGECQTYIELDATFSKGEKLTYRWDPPLYLDDPNSATPEFRAGETTKYVLTVTDDDGIEDTDTMTVTVLPPPLANAGADKFLMIDGNVALDGRLTTPTSGLEYLWQTKDGHIIEGTNIGRIASADSLGTYTLTVTDAAKCISVDTVVVYRFYYLPFAIPDYYSTRINTPLTGENVLDNDFDPNNLFTLTVTPDNKTTKNGGKVVIQADGSFVYTPKTGFSGIDDFTYELCNSAEPPRCSKGYVRITVNNDINIANLNIRKDVINREAKIGEPEGVRFMLTIINRGVVRATGVTVTDTLSRYITDWKYSTNNWITNQVWTGAYTVGNLEPGDSIKVQIRGKLTNDAPDIVYNAATVASGVFDDSYDWGDPYNRNVDTARVIVVSDLLAKAELIERWGGDKNKFDQTIGFCDVASVLSAAKSLSINPIDYYQWVPSAWVKSPNDSITSFTPVKGDTTMTFTLMVTSGERISVASVKVNISPEVVADVGPPYRKYNEGIPLEIDASNSTFADGSEFEWFTLDGMPIKEYKGNDKLHPVVNGAGIHMLIITDKHGCSDMDTLTVRENQLYAVNDILVVVINDTVMANVMTNDYDPDGDSLYFTGVTMMPAHGDLLPAPPGINGQSANNVYISDNGNFIYKPDKNYIGDDQFTYRICDDNNPDLCREAKVFIKVIDVSRVNSQPVANADYYFINKNDTLVNNLMLNDFDYDGGLITLNTAPMSVPKKGKVSLLADGTMTYIPYTGEEGIDSFQYRICDFGKPSLCDTAYVFINIFKLSQENHKPIAVDDAYYAVEKAIKGNILANDYDADGNAISLDMTGYSLPQNGSLFLRADGSFEYTPNLGFEGTDYFTYKIYEVGTAEMYSSSATVYITSLSEDRYYTDVEIVKSGPANILSGDTLVYKLDINILGSTLANDIVITDTLYSGLSKPQFSLDDGVTWEAWKGSFYIQQMMLYDDIQLLVRGMLPDVYSGKLPNTGWVDHDMHETKPENNDSTFIVDVYQRVIAYAGNDTTIGSCYKTQENGYILNASKSLGMSTLTYKWTPANKVESPEKVKSNINLEAEEVQKFTLVVTSSYMGYFDSDTAEVWVKVAEKAVADAGRDIEPTGKDSVWLDGSMSNGVGPLQYTWYHYDLDKNQVIDGKSDSVRIGKTGEYYLEVRDIYGCPVTDRVNVIYPIDPFIAIDDNAVTPQQEAIKIPVLANDIIDPDDEYDFEMFIVIQQPSHGTISEVVQQVGDSVYAYIVYTPDPYFVGVDTFTYIVSTKYSNPDEAIVIIKVLERPPIVPGGFSPNGDGINDFLIIENIEKYGYNVFTIFNRWGNVVYKKEKYSNDEPWNGVANKGVRIGRGVVPGGAYMFLLDLGDDERIPKEKNPVKGNIYIATE